MKKNLLSLLAVGAVAFALTGCETTHHDEIEPDGSFQEAESFEGAVPGSYDDFRVNIADRIFFGYDSSKLTGAGMGILDQQADWLAQYPSVDIIVEGHADIRGTREYNLALGERRAKSIKDYLVTKGVDPNRIHTVSYGKERVEFEGDSTDIHSKNRRGVSVIQ